MSVSTSRLSYSDCFTLFEAAEADKLGARLPFPTRAAANEYRLRMNTARSIDRKDNAEMYAAEHPLHGRSSYDRYVMRIRQDGDRWYLYVELYDTEDFQALIEPLSTTESLPWSPPLRLPPPESSSSSGDELTVANTESPSPPTTPDGSSDNSTTPGKRRGILALQDVIMMKPRQGEIWLCKKDVELDL